MKKIFLLIFFIFTYCTFTWNISAQNDSKKIFTNTQSSNPEENFIFTESSNILSFVTYDSVSHSYKTLSFKGIINTWDKSRITFTGINYQPLLLGTNLISSPIDYLFTDVISHSKTYKNYLLPDSTEASVVVINISKENVDEYIYHVVENDSMELVPWSTPSLEQKYGADRPYGYLGNYNAPGKQILIEIVNKNNYAIRDGILFDWRNNFRPSVYQIITVSTSNKYSSIYPNYKNKDSLKYDPDTKMPANLKLIADSLKKITFKFSNHETIPYEIVLNKFIGKESLSSKLDPYFIEKNFTLSSDEFMIPGKYELLIQPNLSIDNNEENQKFRFNFEILPSTQEKRFSFSQILKFGSGIIILFLVFFSGYYLISKRRLKTAINQKEFINLKLKSIQSQLNPHFMFNALGSIQNLMNKSDINGANHYLGKFSDLARKVLDTGDREMISLEDELTILENYLQMEQLRFDFLYEINVDEQINKANTEIPSMLLQPFIENAIKHGVSSLINGIVLVSANQEKDNLILLVKDNGRGFNMEQINDNSMGIKLVNERITLLNQSFKARLIELIIDSGESGTTIILKLNNWI